MKEILKAALVVLVAFILYLGTVTLLGSTFMHDDWRILFLGAIPSIFVIFYAYWR